MTPKRQSVIRTWFQAAWFVLTNSYIRGFTKGKIFAGNTKVICFPGLNCYSCPGALAACPMGSLQAVMGNSSYRISLYVFGMLSALGVVFGRLICGWMCPFGLFQDLLHKIPIMKKIKNLPGHKYLKYLRYVILVVFPILLVSIFTDLTGTGDPWFCEWICPSGMLFGGIPLVIVNESLRQAIGGRFIWKLIVLLACTITAIKVYRPFCKYMCPLGAIYGLFNPISSYRLVIDKEKCVSCGMCQKACGIGIKTFETPNSMDCIRCGSCIAACPKGAISSTWGLKRDKIRERCFIDDEKTETKASEGPVKNKAVVFGILTVIHGLYAVYMIFNQVFYPSIINRLTIDTYNDYFPAYLVFEGLLVIAAAMLLFTGIYLIISCGRSDRLISVVEKITAALIMIVAAYVIGIVGAIIDPKTKSQILGVTIYYYASTVFGILIALFLAAGIKKMILTGDSDKKRTIIWMLFSFLYLAALFLTQAMRMWVV